MKYDAILFDLDGTLWDASAQIAEAWNQTLQGLREELAPYGKGALLTPADIRAVCGMTMDAIADKLFGGHPNKSAFADRCYSHETAYLLAHPGQVYAEVGEALKALSQRVPLCVVSNCQTGYIEAFLETSGFAEFFSGHISFGDTGRPKWENIRRMCEQQHFQRPIYVGDTQHDAESAALAGTAFAHVRYGFGAVQKADLFIDAPGDLTALLGA